MPKGNAHKLEEKVPPAERLALENKARESFQVAQGLLKRKQYKQAFLHFKEALSHAQGTRFFPPKKDITTLLENYRPTSSALKRLRDRKEKLIIEQIADTSVVSQWATLNECLGQKKRIVAVFRRLKSEDASYEALKSLYWQIWETLVEEQQYEELRPFLNTLGWYTLTHVSDYHAAKWFPPGGKSRAYKPARIIQKGVSAYETALALGANDGAKLLEEKLLSVDNGDATYAALIRAAQRAGARQEAQNLFQRARESLGARRVRKSKKSLELVY